MDDALTKRLQSDENGLLTYEYIANNINNGIEDDLDQLVDNIIGVDKKGQFVVSTARYLNAIDKKAYGPQIDRLIKAAITVDRERAYLPVLAASIWAMTTSNALRNSLLPTTISGVSTNDFIQSASKTSQNE